jgi:voltage-gated potassium channel
VGLLRKELALMRALEWAVRQPEVRQLVTLLAVMVTGAGVFYSWVEGWSLFDATYFSVMTLATVGYGEFAPQTFAGKLFTVVFVICGIGLFATTAGTLAHQAILRIHGGTP